MLYFHDIFLHCNFDIIDLCFRRYTAHSSIFHNKNQYKINDMAIISTQFLSSGCIAAFIAKSSPPSVRDESFESNDDSKDEGLLREI